VGRGNIFSIVAIPTSRPAPQCHHPPANLKFGIDEIRIIGDWIMMITLIWRSALFVLLTTCTVTLMALPYLS
jgi:hypothetical protein